MHSKIMKKIYSKYKSIILGVLLTIALTGILSMCLVLIGSRFVFVEKQLYSFIIMWTILFCFMLASASYISISKSIVNKKQAVMIYASVVIISLLSFAVVDELITFNCVPFLLTSLLLLTLTDKYTAIVIDITVLAMFAVALIFTIDVYSDMVRNLIALVTYFMGSIFTITVIKKSDGRLKIIWKSFAIVFLVFMINFISTTIVTNPIFAIKQCAWLFLGWFIGVGMFMILLPLYEYVFRLSTDLKLTEFIRSDAPLLKEMKEKAPGTFNHSVQVANLAESCADAIGEDTLIARVAAYYHDIGKIKNPEIFTENQLGKNPHDELIPEVSVSMITKHTTAGAELLAKSHLPEIIVKTALEHHGNTVVQYFYNKAQRISEMTLSTENYRYADHKPTTKIAAIVMIADTCEAATRANMNNSYEELATLVKKLVNDKLYDGQFSNCEITMKDLSIIEKTIIDNLPGMYHKRVKYNNSK